MSDEILKQQNKLEAAPVVRKKRRSKKRKKRSDAGVKRGPKVEASSSESPQSSRKVRREPFGGFKDKLAVYNKDPNYFYFWHAERGDDIERAIAAGYRFVSRRDAGRELPEALRDKSREDKEDGPMRIHGGAGEHGQAYKLVLMRIPMELHLEDQKVRDARAALADSAVFRKELEGGKVVDNVYGDVSGIHTKVGPDADQ